MLGPEDQRCGSGSGKGSHGFLHALPVRGMAVRSMPVSCHPSPPRRHPRRRRRCRRPRRRHRRRRPRPRHRPRRRWRRPPARMKAPTGTPARVRAAPGWWRWWSHAISRTRATRSLALKTIRSTASPAIPPSSSAGCWCRRTCRHNRPRRHRLDANEMCRAATVMRGTAPQLHDKYRNTAPTPRWWRPSWWPGSTVSACALGTHPVPLAPSRCLCFC